MVEQSLSFLAPRARVFVALVVCSVVRGGVGEEGVLQQRPEPGFAAVACEVVRGATLLGCRCPIQSEEAFPTFATFGVIERLAVWAGLDHNSKVHHTVDRIPEADDDLVPRLDLLLEPLVLTSQDLVLHHECGILLR